MKRLSFCLAILLLLSFGIAFAQPPGNVFIRLGNVTPSVGTDSIRSGAIVSFPLIYGNRDTNSYNTSNAYRIYSPDGATWAHATANGGNVHGLTGNGLWVDTTGLYHKTDFTGLYKFTTFGADGAGADTVQWSGAGGTDDNNLPTLAVHKLDSGVYITLKILTKVADEGKHICIDSCTNYPPSGAWKWPAFNFQPAFNAFPTWSGAHCYTIAPAKNDPPNFTNCPAASITGSHCAAFTYDLNAVDPDGDSPIVFSLVSGIGAIDANSGVWTATGVATGTHTVVVGVTDPTGSGRTNTCQFDVIATNVGPTITCPQVKTVSTGEIAKDTIKATDDCDAVSFFIGTSTATGATINPVTGVVTYTGDTADVAGSPVCATVGVTDGVDTAYCQACFNVVKGCKYKVRIEKQLGSAPFNGVLQGAVTTVGVYLDAADGVAGLGGFDLLIAYDNSVLSFQTAVGGAIYANCAWEYFTYRVGANGNCSGGCPSGLIRIVGIAETNNGAHRAGCQPSLFSTPLGYTLATLQFLVSNNRTYECQFVPIRFFWTDCTDNTLSSADGSKLYISCSVKDFDSTILIYTDPMPTYLGANNDCLTSTQKAFVKREVDFVNGGIKIICGKDIDARGDVNLNGLAYEIADAVMFTNYFIAGLPAFGTHQAGSIAASDVNADGLSLSVADLVYLIRVIVGDAVAYDKANATVSAQMTVSDGKINISGADLGAVHMVLKGNVVPTLVNTDAQMIFGFNGTNTNVLVHIPFNLENYAKAIKGFNGDIISVTDAQIVSIEGADIYGAKTDIVSVPKAFALNQNYPNPFNPTTTISFAMPVAGNYSIKIYNVTGQKVAEFSDTHAAGTVDVVWDASSLASGVYFYKLDATGYSATKKAVLLK